MFDIYTSFIVGSLQSQVSGVLGFVFWLTARDLHCVFIKAGADAADKLS
jgi:hypothetical protein